MELTTVFYDEHTKTWSGAKEEPFYYPNCSLGKVIFKNLKTNPGNIMQISDSEGTTMTNQECLTAAVRMAQHFKKMALDHEDVVGIVARSTHYLMALGVACLFNCTPFHAVNVTYDEKTLAYILSQTKPKVIFCDGEDYEKVKAATKDFQPLLYTLFEHIDGVPKVQDLLEPTPEELFYKPVPLTLGADQTVAFLSSSGTTGLPKTVSLSINQMFIFYEHLTSDDVIFSNSSLDWVTGLWATTAACTIGCTRVITNKSYSPEYIVQLVRKYKITFLMAAPRHVNTLVKCPTATPENMASIKIFSIGGGCIAIPTLHSIQNIAKNATIIFAYGATEIGNITLNTGMDKSNSVGKPMAGTSIRIVDESGHSLGHNELGEVLCKHNHHWNGYYNNPVDTLHMRDLDGWFHTGDVGYFDSDNYLYIVDRVKDICKYNGMQFWPSEIERCISEIPGVLDVCVVGIYDESVGDKSAALIVKAQGSQLSEENVIAYVAKKLILPQKQLNAGVLFVDKLPENGNSKLLKRAAREIFEEAMKNVDSLSV